MDKTYEFQLDRHQAHFLFKPLRKKQDAVRILLEAIKIMLVYEEPAPRHQGVGKFVLKISKMSRLVFEGSGKIFSINFPFKVVDDAGFLRFFTSTEVELDSFLTSEVMAFISEDGVIYSDDFFDFASPIVDSNADKREFWLLVRELFFYEDGYLRVDHDEDNQDGHYHPLDHFDFFYSGNATFKVGLVERYTIDNVLDVLDVTTPCHYLRSVQ
ncbi:hypothetical protein [Halomonas caseinilytica]|uniref:hypothetical protein n=1 Tax=Halomonas caseinilytica TaxID=438744 RepID=UPI00147BB99A|nr:hypothetical protein [Halomonas caseinilytica]